MLGRVLWIGFVVAIGLALYLSGAAVIAKFKIPPPPEPDPTDLREVEYHFQCSVCGAEVTMTATPNSSDLEAPRHCREDMVLVSGPDET